MRRVTVQNECPEGTAEQPSDAARKRAAVELIRSHDRQLRWSARRYSICAEDAEDAYQRGIEILLAKAPSTESSQLLPWTRTVIKHEALAIRKSRERTMSRPVPPSDHEHANEDWVQLIPSESDGPDELAIGRERVARSREALGLLKPAELKALTQLAEGFSYSEIGQMNDWTRTKVNRCLAEGRARFRSAFRDSEAGERCHIFEPLLSASCDGELTSDQIRHLENHLDACGHCRATLRSYRAAPRAAAALAPVLPFGPSLWGRVQEFAVTIQTRVQGIGRGSESGIQGVVASGGTGGIAATAKLAAICAGTAGTAVVCAAAGFTPAVDLAPKAQDEVPIERTVDVRPPAPSPVELQVAEPELPASDGTPGVRDESEPQEQEKAKPTFEEPTYVPAPEPTPTQAEFTPEVAGTPVTTAAPPPPASTSQSTTSQVPLGNGGGEFAP